MEDDSWRREALRRDRRNFCARRYRSLSNTMDRRCAILSENAQPFRKRKNVHTHVWYFLPEFTVYSPRPLISLSRRRRDIFLFPRSLSSRVHLTRASETASLPMRNKLLMNNISGSVIPYCILARPSASDFTLDR